MSTPSRKSNGTPRIAVIGAGVIGLACALELKRRGADVAVYERGTELGAGVTVRAAGMLGVLTSGPTVSQALSGHFRPVVERWARHGGGC